MKKVTLYVELVLPDEVVKDIESYDLDELLEMASNEKWFVDSVEEVKED